MFSIDRALLPSLPTRRALIVVDPQNDFLDEDGALPIKIPMDLPERIADLATAFRQSGGDIIWACSRFEKSRSVLDEQVLTSDRSSNPRSPDLARGRRRQASPQMIQTTECPEAFLTQESAKTLKCVRPGTSGIEMHPTVKEAVGPRDYSIVKSFYSAFRSEQLLRLLRMRLVTELFICGSMTNISVMATAVDAASHGYTITIIDDCCGYHNMMRHRAALKQISNTTGCDILPAEAVLSPFKPKPKASRRSADRPTTSPGGKYPIVRRSVGGEDDSSLTSSTSQLQSSFENLSLSAERADDDSNFQTPARDSAPSLPPLVRSQEPTDRNGNSGLKADPSALKSDMVELDGPQTKLENDESQRNSHSNDGDDLRDATLDKELLPPKIQSKNSIVPQDTFEESQSDKEQNSAIQDDGTESTSELSLKATGETPDAGGSKRGETLAEVSKTEVENRSTMMPQDAISPRESHPLCEGDTKVIYHVLPPPLSENIFERIRDEVRWQRMSHQGGEVPRLVAVQGQVDEDGSMPVYRHPADESPPLLPFSPAVLEIKNVIEKKLGHPLNHVLIQFYRDGNDYISEHSDKTLDIAKGSSIANVSLGAERTMTFRTKRQGKNRTSVEAESSSSALKRQVERARLPHNSLCKMGLVTNMRWLHGIRQDKRMEREKSKEELAYDGGRISLTFRQIATFLDQENRLIWGQGATGKARDAANQVINGQTQEAIKMLQGFGRENQSTEFDWDEFYGSGFDVLHISTAPRLFLSPDPVANTRIQLMLAEYGISYARGSMSPLFNWKDGKPTRDPSAIPEDLPIRFVDNDFEKTTVQGEVAIMLYLDRIYTQKAQDKPPRKELAKQFTRFQQGLTLLEKYRADPEAKSFQAELAVWEGYAAEGNEFIAGPSMTLADYAFWPVLNDIIRVPGRCEFGDGGIGFENLKMYHERIRTRESGKKVLVVCASCTRKKPTEGAPDAAASSSNSAAAPTTTTT
ncbi:hypothetical protein AAE478_007248 [Parahypoxylon ruwenzoriense]